MVYLWAAHGKSSAKLGSEEKLYGHLHEINDVSIFGRHILSASDDASVLIWEI